MVFFLCYLCSQVSARRYHKLTTILPLSVLRYIRCTSYPMQPQCIFLCILFVLVYVDVCLLLHSLNSYYMYRYVCSFFFMQEGEFPTIPQTDSNTTTVSFEVHIYSIDSCESYLSLCVLMCVSHFIRWKILLARYVCSLFLRSKVSALDKETALLSLSVLRYRIHSISYLMHPH